MDTPIARDGTPSALYVNAIAPGHPIHKQRFAESGQGFLGI
ncbi:MAG TPA: hypothetical protein VFV38_01710 [Ktedonobacteraceae bacterium]|nr:hypothetical protein [Ktedonobacteraceae bacterium]